MSLTARQQTTGAFWPGRQTALAQPVLARLAIPLAAMLALLMLGMYLTLAVQHRSWLNQTVETDTRQALKHFRQHLLDHVQIMSGILDVLAEQASVRQAIRTGDRNGLLAGQQALFRRIGADHQISHMYFHDPQRRNLARLHHPASHGDRIDRRTLMEAGRTGRTIFGIEPGPYGPYTLRVVKPVREQGVLLGYMELGMEVGHLLSNLHEWGDFDLVVTLAKSALNKREWLEAMRGQGQKPDWNRFSGDVLAYASLAELPGPVERFIERSPPGGPVPRAADLTYADRDLRAAVVSMPFATSPDASKLFLIHDTSAIQSSHRQLLMAAGMTGTALLVLLLVFVVLLLRRSDRNLLAGQAALRETRSRLQAILDHAPLGIWLAGMDGKCQFVNRTLIQSLGIARRPEDSGLPSGGPDGQVDGLDDLIGMPGAMACATCDRRCEGLAEQCRETHVVTLADGATRSLDVIKVLMRDDAGKPLGVVGMVLDITERQRAESASRLYARLFGNSGEAMLITDHENRIVDVNPAFTRLSGFTLEEVRGENPRLLSTGDTPPEVYQAMWRSLEETGHWEGELWDRRKDGGIYPKWLNIFLLRDEAGQVTHHAATFSDISERKAAEARIEHLAHHDPLTGLLNRYSLENRLQQAMNTARRVSQQLAVMFIDMDRFKLINDSLGHPMGDRMLREVACRLRETVRESDIVARMGGDEFVVVLSALENPQDAMAAAGKILAGLGEPYEIEGHVLHSSPSIGVAIFPQDGETPEILMQNADTAMYHAKENGRNNVRFFTGAMNAMASERMEMERDLRVALAAGELELHYQPKIRTSDGRICGLEALLRWHHPRHGMVMPNRFIPVAEEAGLIESIGAWVIDRACAQLAEWHADGMTELHMAVNLSAQQLRSPGLVADVRASLDRHRLGSGDLELEITESVAMENPDRATSQLRALRALGVELAIDDFGTGYSSLAYLKYLPIQTLKLDRSFVRDIESDANDAAISAATVALAHTLGLKVVAEGVETEAQRDYLGRDHACDYLQGYLFGRPESAAEVGRRLRESRWEGGSR